MIKKVFMTKGSNPMSGRGQAIVKIDSELPDVPVLYFPFTRLHRSSMSMMDFMSIIEKLKYGKLDKCLYQGEEVFAFRSRGRAETWLKNKTDIGS